RAPVARPALFLDRDGVLNRRVIGGYVMRPDQLCVLSVATAAARTASNRGAAVVIVSNQGVIGRELATESDVLAVNAALLAELAERGVKTDAVYVCPHHPEA